MARTLKDLILVGGIRGQCFIDLATGSNRPYRVIDIERPSHNHSYTMFVQYLDDRENEYKSIDGHAEDTLIENQPTQSAQTSEMTEKSQAVADLFKRINQPVVLKRGDF